MQAVSAAFELLAPGLDELAIGIEHHHAVGTFARGVYSVVHVDAALRVFAYAVRVAVLDICWKFAPVVRHFIGILAFADYRFSIPRLARSAEDKWRAPARVHSRSAIRRGLRNCISALAGCSA